MEKFFQTFWAEKATKIKKVIKILNLHLKASVFVFEQFGVEYEVFYSSFNGPVALLCE